MSHAEDEYNGYRIPKGSILIPNSWSVLAFPSPLNLCIVIHLVPHITPTGQCYTIPTPTPTPTHSTPPAL